MITIEVFKFDELAPEIQKKVHEKYAYILCDYYDLELNELWEAIDKILEDLGIESQPSYYNQQDYLFRQETSWDWQAGPQKMRRLFLENFPDVHEWNYLTEIVVTEIWKALRQKKNKSTTDVIREALDNASYTFERSMYNYYDFEQFKDRLRYTDHYFTAEGNYVGAF